MESCYLVLRRMGEKWLFRADLEIMGKVHFPFTGGLQGICCLRTLLLFLYFLHATPAVQDHCFSIPSLRNHAFSIVCGSNFLPKTQNVMIRRSSIRSFLPQESAIRSNTLILSFISQSYVLLRSTTINIASSISTPVNCMYSSGACHTYRRPSSWPPFRIQQHPPIKA